MGAETGDRFSPGFGRSWRRKEPTPVLHRSPWTEEPRRVHGVAKELEMPEHTHACPMGQISTLRQSLEDIYLTAAEGGKESGEVDFILPSGPIPDEVPKPRMIEILRF